MKREAYYEENREINIICKNKYAVSPIYTPMMYAETI